MLYKMQRCPKCKAGSFEVSEDELAEAEGVIECENCGTMLEPVEQILTQVEPDPLEEIEKQIQAILSGKKAKSKPALSRKCTNQILEEDGFCVLCGMNHWGGERVEKLQALPLVNGKKAEVKSSEVFHQHVPLFHYDW